MIEGSKAKRERTCIGCGTKAGKQQLHRIVRCADGSISYDAKGNTAGRGAYVCSHECFEKALAGGKLQRALRVSLKSEEAQRAGNEIAAACVVKEK